MLRKNDNRGIRQGYLVIELAVAIAIISLLVAVVAVAVVRGRAEAKEQKTLTDLAALRLAIIMLHDHTEKWPNGCPPDSVSNPEVGLDQVQAGLSSQPLVGDQGDGCEWTSDDLTAWRGPYVTEGLHDPWGNEYVFDPDYVPYQNCGSKATKPQEAYILSYGPNGVGLNVYDCDDIFIILRK
ncbi:hypothetical protein AMJ57_03890 [Parcubacteria bacterium SG8_24]|nr:MAG: hypothetical protein AMJ57_03890 [Parcubacteria bacterium SG8_24]